MTCVAWISNLMAIALVGQPVPTDKRPATDKAPVGAGAIIEGHPAASHPLIALLEAELAYSMNNLVAPDDTRPYYLGYAVYDEHLATGRATLGAITDNHQTHTRNLNIDLRVGDYRLDNTHQLRDRGRGQASGSGSIPLALDDDPHAIKHTLWFNTDRVFKTAAKRFADIKTNLKVKVEEEDRSDDFSREEAHVHYDAPVELTFDREAWGRRLRGVSAIARDFPLIYDSSITIGSLTGTRYLVTSEGARLQTSSRRYRITLTAATKADDGMDLAQNFTFNTAAEAKLPDDAEIKAAFRRIIRQVLSLREAPIAKPYLGPAILRNRASAVFFHEILGHRLEGHRQKDVTEGQTFTKKIGESILPAFMNVRDDPTRAEFDGIDLCGYYLFDDEGVRASDVRLVDRGILQTFLMSRRPLENIPQSNGHGRRQAGRAVVARQGNLIVESTRQVPFERLRELLIEECHRQGKPYGLLLEDVSGGLTTTRRRGMQAFKVLPVVVYRVYADGRPDELIRGVDLVGTPLTCFEKIICTGDDPAVFNGSCGAESGWVPVSAVSPSILVSTIEIEKRTHAQSRPPILEPPASGVP